MQAEVIVIAAEGDLSLVRSGDRWGTAQVGVLWRGYPIEWHAQDRGVCEVCEAGVETFGEWRCAAHPEPRCSRCPFLGYALGAFCDLRPDDAALSEQVARLRLVDEPAPAECPRRNHAD